MKKAMNPVRLAAGIIALGCVAFHNVKLARKANQTRLGACRA
jgi:hypothetical protein